MNSLKHRAHTLLSQISSTIEQKLFNQPAYSLLYVTGNKICRLDSDRKGQSIGELAIFDIPCENSYGLPNAIEKLTLQIQQPLGRKCWILYSRLSSQVLSLPEAQITGLDNKTLIETLRFEYEAVTGEVLKNSQLSYQLLNTVDEMSQFWVQYIGTETLTKIIDRLTKAKSSLAGLIHAGGLPYLLTLDNAETWLKIEYWPECVYGLNNSLENGVNLQIFYPEHSLRWQEELNQWLLEAGAVHHSEALLTSTQLEKNPAVKETAVLTPEGHLQSWMQLWLQHLLANEAVGIPVLQQQANVNKELWYMVGSGIAALVLCGSHAGWMLYQTASYENNLKELNQTKQEMDGYRKGVTDNQKSLSELEKQYTQLSDNSQSVPAAITTLKQRPAKLLKIIAQHCPEDVVIEDIKQKEQQLVIVGVALKPELSNQLAIMIEQPLADLGWKVAEPTSRGLNVFGKESGQWEGGPWEFELVLEDLGLKSFLKQTKS